MKVVKDNRGVVPLLTSIFLGVLLSIIAIAFIRLAITERRQATDDDLTTAAFYAAESGLEDARRAINEYVLSASYGDTELNGDSCNPAQGTEPTLGNTDLDLDYTCQLIDLTPEILVAKPGAGNSHLFRVDAVDSTTNAAATMDRIVIKWNDIDNDGERSPRPASSTGNLTVGDWTSSSNNFPAMLRVNVFSIRRGDFRVDDLRNSGESYTAFIDPRDVASTTHRLTVEDFDSEVLPGGCDNSGSSYTCEVTIDLSDDGAIANSQTSSDYWLRDVPERYRQDIAVVFVEIQTLYQNDTVQLEIFDGSTRRSFQDAQARVDVTGRSGESFRRIETFIPLENRGLELPNYTLIGGDRICKEFFVTDDASEFGTLNPSIDGSCSTATTFP